MKKGLTELVFILDRSGSMRGLEKDTIGGFNGLIAQQADQEGEAYVSVVLFDDRSEVIYDRVPIRKVEEMTDRQYYVRGCTALLDALGGAIHHIGTIHKYAREEDRPEKTLFVITTDGMENASRQYDYREVKQMVERQKEKYGWEFLFLGANIDAVETAGRFGISADRAANYACTSEGTQVNFRSLNRAVSAMRMENCKEKCAIPDDWADEINACYEAAKIDTGRDKTGSTRSFGGKRGTSGQGPASGRKSDSGSKFTSGLRRASDQRQIEK